MLTLLIFLQLLTYDSLFVNPTANNIEVTSSRPNEPALGALSNEKETVCPNCGQTVYYIWGRGPYDKKNGYIYHKCTSTPISDIPIYFIGAFFIIAILTIYIRTKHDSQ